MPTAISLYATAVWFCVGLFTGFGWGIGAWLANRMMTAK
jgi:hypothetical protein